MSNKKIFFLQIIQHFAMEFKNMGLLPFTFRLYLCYYVLRDTSNTTEEHFKFSPM